MDISLQEIEKRIKDSYELPNQVVKTIPHPLVTVRTITYKHPSYITACIEGVLMQKTSFPFEYIIGEDCSTDGTIEKIMDYAEHYPEKIRVITADYNTGGFVNAQRCNRLSRGRYIALCEGDDYWTDPYKLQKQVDFLESHSEYGIVYTDYDIFEEDSNRIIHSANSGQINANHLSAENGLFEAIIRKKIKIPTSTVIFRRELLEQIPLNNRVFCMGDTPLWLDLAKHTRFYYIDTVTCVYRKLKKSASRPARKRDALFFKLSSTEMRIYYCHKYNFPIPEKLQKQYNHRLIDYLFLNPSYKPIYPVRKLSVLLKLKRWLFLGYTKYARRLKRRVNE